MSLALWFGSAWALLPQNFNGQLQAILTHQKNPSVDKLHQVIGNLEGSIGLLAKALPTITTAFEGKADFFLFYKDKKDLHILQKSPNDIKPNATQEKIPFSNRFPNPFTWCVLFCCEC